MYRKKVKAEKTAVVLAVEKALTQQSEHNGGSRHGFPIAIGCDESLERRARFSMLPGGKCQHELHRERKTDTSHQGMLSSSV